MEEKEYYFESDLPREIYDKELPMFTKDDFVQVTDELKMTNPFLYNFKEYKNIVYSIEEFGLNNALVSINVKVNFISRIYVPLQSKIIDTTISVPLYSKIIEGDVPSFYPGLIDGVNKIYSSEVKI